MTADEIEVLFCIALLPEGTDVVERVTRRFLEMRDNPKPEIKQLILQRQSRKSLEGNKS